MLSFKRQFVSFLKSFNVVMENFFGHCKTEMYHGEHYASVEQFSQAVDDYIVWYNYERLQQRFKG
ncbi:IS3 family transposase, partial [Corynebacterium sp. HS2168-gen11]|uniref:IS3 family transposase n=1 Tax=Corynebacterium sp. HS2168-gen11 TaxID=2974027 RepID=UPI0037C0F20A